MCTLDKNNESSKYLEFRLTAFASVSLTAFSTIFESTKNSLVFEYVRRSTNFSLLHLKDIAKTSTMSMWELRYVWLLMVIIFSIMHCDKVRYKLQRDKEIRVKAPYRLRSKKAAKLQACKRINDTDNSRKKKEPRQNISLRKRWISIFTNLNLLLHSVTAHIQFDQNHRSQHGTDDAPKSENFERLLDHDGYYGGGPYGDDYGYYGPPPSAQPYDYDDDDDYYYDDYGYGGGYGCETPRVNSSNGECVGQEFLLEMSDSYGDGWNCNILYISPTIKISIDTYDAISANTTICLPPGEYTPYCCGGEWDSEVYWSIGGLIGSADNSCRGTAGSFTARDNVPTALPSNTLAPTVTNVPSMSPAPTILKIFSTEALRIAVSSWCDNADQAKKIYGPIDSWITSDVDDMSHLFDPAGFCSTGDKFSEDISRWDVTNVRNMESMFEGCEKYNGNLSSWNVARVKNFKNMFTDAKNFSGHTIGRWDVSQSTTFEGTFKRALNFEGDLGNWQVSKATTFEGMFEGALRFNGDLSSWNVQKSLNFRDMFRDASSFVGCDPLRETDSPTLAPTDILAPTSFGFTYYFSPSPLPTPQPTSLPSQQPTLFPTRIAGLSIWDVSQSVTFEGMFFGAISFNCGDLDNWDVSASTSLESMFYGATNFTGKVSSWQVSKVTTLKNAFRDAISFDSDVGGWQTSSVTTMQGTFAGAEKFNRYLSWQGKNTPPLTTIRLAINHTLYLSASLFSCLPLHSHALVSNVRDMSSMFYGASSFNQNLPWDTSAVTTLDSTFRDAINFQGDISTWDVSQVTTLQSTFQGELHDFYLQKLKVCIVIHAISSNFFQS